MLHETSEFHKARLVAGLTVDYYRIHESHHGPVGDWTVVKYNDGEFWLFTTNDNPEKLRLLGYVSDGNCRAEILLDSCACVRALYSETRDFASVTDWLDSLADHDRPEAEAMLEASNNQ